MPITVNPPIRFGPPPRSGDYPAPFEVGYWRQIFPYVASGERRLFVEENYGYTIWNITNPVAPVIINSQDIQGTAGYTKDGDAFETISSVWAAEDGSRVLVSYKQAPHTVLLMKPSGSAFTFAGEFDSGRTIPCIVKLPSRYLGFAASRISTLGVKVKVADITTFINGAPANQPNSIPSSDLDGTENVISLTSAGTYLIGADLNSKLVFINATGAASPPTSGITTTTIPLSATGFPTGTFLGKPSIGIHPVNGRIYVAVEGRDSSGQSRGVALLYSQDSGATFQQAGPVLAPLASHPIAAESLHIAATNNALYVTTWSYSAVNRRQRLRVVDASNWPNDLTPNADFDVTTYGSDFSAITQVRSVFIAPGTLHLYVAASYGGFVVTVGGLDGGGGGGPALPGAPSSVVGTPISGSQVNLSWGAASNGGSPIQYYEVVAQPASGPATTRQTTGDVVTYSFTGLVPATTYTFTVRARNGVGFGPAASSGPVTTPGGSGGATAPGPPSNVVGTAASSNAANITWTPGTTGGLFISGYVIRLDEIAASPRPSQTFTLTGAASSYLVAGIGPGGVWRASVAAVNGIGTGAEAQSPNFTLPSSPNPGGTPSEVLNVLATSDHLSQSVTLQWGLPAIGVPLTGFRIVYTKVGGGVIQNQDITDGFSTRVPSMVLNSFSQYTATVQATNTNGTGPASAPSNIFGVAPLPDGETLPGAVTGVVATADTATSAVVTWNAPAPGSSPLTVYEVYVERVQTGGDVLVDLRLVPANVARSLRFTGLNSGGQYRFAVRPNNQHGNGPVGDATITITGGGGIFQITNVVITPNPASVGQQVNLSAQYQNGISPVTFRWIFHDGIVLTGASVTKTYSSAGNYAVRVEATDGNGGTVASSYSVTVQAPQAGDPVISSATAVPNPAQVGQAVTFTVVVTGGTTPYGARWNFSDGQTTTGLTVSRNFDLAGSYSAQVVVQDAAGRFATRNVSFLVESTGASSVPGVPSNVSATAGNEEVTVTWDPPVSDGGSPVTNYRLYRRNNPTFDVTVPPTSRSYSWTGLTNGTSYEFYLAALNSNGEGPTSPPISLAPSEQGGGATPVSIGEIDYNYRLFFEAPVVLDRNRTDYGSFLYPEKVSDFSTAFIQGEGVSYPITITAPATSLYLSVGGTAHTLELSPGAYSLETMVQTLQDAVDAASLPILVRGVLDQVCFQHSEKGIDKTLTLASADSLGNPYPNSVNAQVFGLEPIQLEPKEYLAVENHVPTPEYDVHNVRALVESRPMYKVKRLTLLTPTNPVFQLPNTYIKPNSFILRWRRNDGTVAFARDYKGDGNITIRSFEILPSGTVEYSYTDPIATLDYVTGKLEATGLIFNLPDYNQAKGKPTIDYVWTIAKASAYDHIWYPTPHFSLKLKGQAPQYVSKVQLEYLAKRIDLIRPVNTVLRNFYLVPQVTEELQIREEVRINSVDGVTPPFLVVSPSPSLIPGSYDVSVTNPDDQSDESQNAIDYVQ